MPLQLQDNDAGRAGDVARRRALLAFLTFAIFLPVSVWLFVSLEALWGRIAPLEGAPFMLAATLFGGALAMAPLLAGIGLLLALWFGVESVYLPRSLKTPLIDRCIVAVGLLAWFAPALGLFVAAVKALVDGRIHFVRPPRDYFLATDPVAFWQGVGFWLIMAAIFAFLAWRYWRDKLGSARA